MGRSRRSRRKMERARVKRRAPERRFSPLARLGIGAGGAVGIACGAALLAAGSAGNAERLGRIAGILIILGAVGLILAIVGRL